jgi:hypothetical protein
MASHTFNCQQANQIDMVDYLASLGHEPKKERNQNYWYKSPFREEKTPSFKVDLRLNLWYDHGTGKGGDLVDFGTQYHHCSVSELLSLLSSYQSGQTLSFQQPSLSSRSSFLQGPMAGERKESPDGKIVILNVRPLQDQTLLAYAEKRGIPPDIAQQSCREVDFLLYGKQQTVIGFANRAGGYELRSEQFKGSSSPKDVTLIESRAKEIAVFEGFFDYLSFRTVNSHLQAPLSNCLVLNSLSFLEKSRPLMEKYDRVFLLLHRDAAGRSHTEEALHWNWDKYLDRSDSFKGYKDLNDWHIHELSQKAGPKQDRSIGKSL